MSTPVEDQLRARAPAVDADRLVIRGRPLTVHGLISNATRTAAVYTWQGEPFLAVSAEITGPGRPTEDLLAGKRLRTRRTYVRATPEAIAEAGFSVLETFAAPHVSIVLPGYDENLVQQLITALGPELPNPFFERRTP
jgi:hypothetical protein